MPCKLLAEIKLHSFKWTPGHWGRSMSIRGNLYTWNVSDDARLHTEVIKALGEFNMAARNCCLIAPSGAMRVAHAWENEGNWDQGHQERLYTLDKHLYYDATAYDLEAVSKA